MSKRVFVVDDHDGTLEALAELIRSLGHEPKTTADPREAISGAKAFRPHIALLDVTMPHIDGCELARLFRADDVLHSVCLVAVTGHDGEKHRAMVRNAGFDAHILKPIDVAILALIIEHFGYD